MSFILGWEHLHTTPGVYTFLGLATLPRFQTKANPLRLLPREIIDRIARLAHRDAYLAGWDTPFDTGPGGILSTSIDITRLNDEEDVTLRMARPLRTGVKYVEVTTSTAWYGTLLAFDGLRGSQGFGFQLDYEGFDDVLQRDRDVCVIKMCDPDDRSRYFRIESLGIDTWTWCTDPVTFGVLVDMNRGCVTFRINGINGPCVRFPPGSEWRGGVTIEISEFPTQRKGTPPPDGESLPVVVSCATPPVPPSLLEAAANPLSAWEHVGAGSFEDVTDDYAEYN